MFNEKEFIKFIVLSVKHWQEDGRKININAVKKEIQVMSSYAGMLEKFHRLIVKKVRGNKNDVNSYLAYIFGITTKKPVAPYAPRLDFNLARVSHPDIDIDFNFFYRDDVYQYLIDKYGRESTANIGTYQTLKAKNCLKITAKALDPFDDKQETLILANRLAELVPSDPKMNLEKALELEPELCTYKKKYEEIFKIAKNLENLVCNISYHAAGIVIGSGNLSEIAPFHHLSGDSFATQFEMVELEDLGLIKFDILALKNLSVLDMVVDDLKKDLNIDLDIDNVSFDDKKALALIAKGETTAVFQLESYGMKKLLKQMRVSCFHDVAATNALFRPGALAAGAHDLFCDGKHGNIKITYDHPCLESILKETYGQMIYQEQCQLIAIELAGFTIKEADMLRKAIGKKKADIMAKMKNQFVVGASRKVSPRVAASIWKKIEDFGSYAFNKAHSYAYAAISLQTAYLKAHYPLYYMKSVLNAEGLDGKTDNVIKFMKECIRMRIKLLPCNINKSKSTFEIDGKGLRIAFSSIKGIGLKAGESISELAPFASLDDFIKKVKGVSVINKSVVEILIHEGAFADFKLHGDRGVETYHKTKKHIEYMEKREIQDDDMFDFGKISF
jgi:DNA polymerase-3 subunit alpha